MLRFHGGDGHSYAYIESYKAYAVLSKGEETLLNKLFAVIDEALIAPHLRKPLKQAILQTLFLGV